MTPWAHPSPQTKRHLHRFSCFCTDDHRVSLYFTIGRPFPPQNCQFPWGSGRPSIHGSIGIPESSTQTAHPPPGSFWPVYCGQTVEWMKTPLGTEVDLGPGHIVLDGVPPLRETGTEPPIFSAHVYCGHGRPPQLLLSFCYYIHGPLT